MSRACHVGRGFKTERRRRRTPYSAFYHADWDESGIHGAVSHTFGSCPISVEQWVKMIDADWI